MAEYTILWFLFLSACVLTRYYIDWVTDRTVGLLDCPLTHWHWQVTVSRYMLSLTHGNLTVDLHESSVMMLIQSIRDFYSSDNALLYSKPERQSLVVSRNNSHCSALYINSLGFPVNFFT